MEKELLLQRLMQVARVIWVIIVCFLIVLAAYYIIPLIYPFIIGCLIAYILNPLVNLLCKRARFPRWLASTTALLLFLGITSLFLTLLVSRLVIEITKFSNMVISNIDIWIDEFIHFINNEHLQQIFNQIGSFYAQNEQYHQTIDQNLNNLGQQIANAVTSLMKFMVDGTFNFIVSLPNITFIIVIIVLGSFFISKDWYKILDWISSFFSDSIKKSTLTVYEDLQKALFGYIRAQLIMISITAIFIIIGLLVLNVNYAITIGLLLGLIDLLPYIGIGLVMVPWAIYLFIQGDITLGIGISVLYGIMLVVRSSIEPKVLASSIGMNALATLIAMVVGLNMFGIIGILIGPVTLVILLAVSRAGVFKDIHRYIKNGSAKP